MRLYGTLSARPTYFPHNLPLKGYCTHFFQIDIISLISKVVRKTSDGLVTYGSNASG